MIQNYWNKQFVYDGVPIYYDIPEYIRYNALIIMLDSDKDENGEYESIGYHHSWSGVSSSFMFRIQRHSDHHCHSFKPMQALKKLTCAPTHPYEYTWMIAIA